MLLIKIKIKTYFLIWNYNNNKKKVMIIIIILTIMLQDFKNLMMKKKKIQKISKRKQIKTYFKIQQ